MLRILTTLILSLGLTVSPYLGSLVWQSPGHGDSESVYSAAEVDKPSGLAKEAVADGRFASGDNAASGSASTNLGTAVSAGAHNHAASYNVPMGDRSAAVSLQATASAAEGLAAALPEEKEGTSATDSVLREQAGAARTEDRSENTANSVSEDSAPPAAEEKVINTGMADSGLIEIRYLNQSGKKLKLLIEKEGTVYTYNLKGDKSPETFPLQSGNGDYTVSILENTEGNLYRYLLTETVGVHVGNANAAYLNSIQMIHWDADMAAVKKAAEITSGASREEEKVEKIYRFVVGNIRYDYSKLNNLPSTYLPVIDATLQSGSGICYDFAAITAAMLRSIGIPAKLVMGYADGVNGYHAWNEVYLGGKWVTIDTSYDSQIWENNQSTSMIKDSAGYRTEKEY